MAVCFNSADLCAVRFSLLNEDGTPLCNEEDGTAYTLSPISLQINPTLDAGETVTTRDGCGNICYTRRDPDVPTGADLVLTLCKHDVEFLGLAFGGEVYEGPNGLPAYAQGTQTPPRVEAHFWTKTSDGGAQVASPNNWWHWVFPSVQWSPGNETLGRDALQPVLNGIAQPSGTIGAGAFGDIPTDPTEPYYRNVWTAPDIPDPDEAPYNQNSSNCGFIDTPACS